MAGRSEPDNPLNDERFALVDGVAPLVSVIVTSFNYERHLGRCLSSIARQVYPRFECIVVDDLSTDGSVQLIETFIASEEAAGRFTLVRREQNGGQMAALKTGLGHASGVFVAMVDADDLLLEDFLNAHINAHMGRRNVAFTSSNQYQIDEHDEVVAGRHADLQARTRRRYINPLPLHDPFWVWATTSSMMFRRDVLDLIMPEDTEPYRVCADNYLCHFANLLGGSLLIPETYGCFRRHRANYFSSNPVLGGQLPTGDMRRHPPHQVVRLGILSHLLSRSDEFVGLLSKEFLFATLLRLAGPIDLLKLRVSHPGFFNRSPFPWARFVAASSALLATGTARKYSRFLRRAAVRDARAGL